MGVCAPRAPHSQRGAAGRLRLPSSGPKPGSIPGDYFQALPISDPSERELPLPQLTCLSIPPRPIPAPSWWSPQLSGFGPPMGSVTSPSHPLRGDGSKPRLLRPPNQQRGTSPDLSRSPQLPACSLTSLHSCPLLPPAPCQPAGDSVSLKRKHYHGDKNSLL